MAKRKFARRLELGTHRVRSPHHSLHSELAQFKVRPPQLGHRAKAEWVVLQRDRTQGSVTLPQYIRPLLLCVCLEAYSQSSNGLSSTWTVASSPSPVTPLCAHLAATQPQRGRSAGDTAADQQPGKEHVRGRNHEEPPLGSRGGG